LHDTITKFLCKLSLPLVTSGFRREENCTLLGCYAASSGNSLPTFTGKLSVPS